MTCPPELQDVDPSMPVIELVKRAFWFWRAMRESDCLAGLVTWEPAMDEVLDKLLVAHPELGYRFPLSNVEKARLVARRATDASFKLERGG